MGDRIKNYRKRIDAVLAADTLTAAEWKELLEEHLQQIAFFQHERLIHLIVTITVAILAVLCIGFAVMADSLGFLAAALLLICLFVPYILHYMLLENETEKMYWQYDKILKKMQED